MRKYYLTMGLVAALALGVVAQAQQTQTPPVKETVALSPAKSEEPEAVFDDDGGRVFIVKRNQSSLENLRHHGGEVIAEPEQHSIFLGSGWNDSKLRSTKAGFANLLTSLGAGDERAALERYGVRNLFASAFTHEVLDDFKGNTVSDLQIRASLAKLFGEGTLAAPSASAIYVVYLAPNLRSTLGTMFGGKHYVAYHNYFNAEAGEVRYVVIPFDANKASFKAAAQRALVEALINPSGKGWY